MVKTKKFSRFVLMSLEQIRDSKEVILQVLDTQSHFEGGKKCYLCEVASSLDFYSQNDKEDLIREICKLNGEKRQLEKKIKQLEKKILQL